MILSPLAHFSETFPLLTFSHMFFSWMKTYKHTLEVLNRTTKHVLQYWHIAGATRKSLQVCAQQYRSPWNLKAFGQTRVIPCS